MVGFLGGGFDGCQGGALAHQNVITGLGVCQQVEQYIFQRAADADPVEDRPREKWR
jgi:hypothetical protein